MIAFGVDHGEHLLLEEGKVHHHPALVPLLCEFARADGLDEVAVSVEVSAFPGVTGHAMGGVDLDPSADGVGCLHALILRLPSRIDQRRARLYVSLSIARREKPVFIDDLDSAKLGESGVLLYSGGADSTLLAHSLIRRGKRLIGLSIDYPGRPAAEIAIAERHCRTARSRRASDDRARPSLAPLRGETGGLNEGWFPHRNLMFLGIALHVAEIRGAHFIAAGYARTDGIIFSDATPGFLKLFNTIAAVSSGRRSADREIDILVPFLEKDAFFRSESKRFPDLPALIAETWSCWRDEARPCGVCAACRERAYYSKPSRPTADGRAPWPVPRIIIAGATGYLGTRLRSACRPSGSPA